MLISVFIFNHDFIVKFPLLTFVSSALVKLFPSEVVVPKSAQFPICPVSVVVEPLLVKSNEFDVESSEPLERVWL